MSEWSKGDGMTPADTRPDKSSLHGYVIMHIALWAVKQNSPCYAYTWSSVTTCVCQGHVIDAQNLLLQSHKSKYYQAKQHIFNMMMHLKYGPCLTVTKRHFCRRYLSFFCSQWALHKPMRQPLSTWGGRVLRFHPFCRSQLLLSPHSAWIIAWSQKFQISFSRLRPLWTWHKPVWECLEKNWNCGNFLRVSLVAVTQMPSMW